MLDNPVQGSQDGDDCCSANIFIYVLTIDELALLFQAFYCLCDDSTSDFSFLSGNAICDEALF